MLVYSYVAPRVFDVVDPGSAGGPAAKVNMARCVLCRAVGVFQLSRTPTLLTGTRLYSQTEPEPPTVRQQNDGIRCGNEMSPSSLNCYSQVLSGRNSTFTERIQTLTTTSGYSGTFST